MIDLSDIAARLDADEKLKLTYRFPVSSGGGSFSYEIRTAPLLDVAPESNLLYVRYEGEVVWVNVEEALEVSPE